MGYQRYKIICKDCGATEIIQLKPNDGVIWGKPKMIISARRRLDNQWGFQCFCGNNDLLSKQERKEISNFQQPDPKEIRKVVNNIKPSKMNFAMEAV